MKCWALPASASWCKEWAEGRKRGPIQLSPGSVSMAMAPEAGQNILSGNSGSHSPSPKPHWPRWPLCHLDSGSRGGTWEAGLPAFLLSAAPRGARESVKPPLKAKGRGAAGMEGPSSPRWSLIGGPGAGYPLGLWGPPACLTFPGKQHRGLGPFPGDLRHN